MAFTDDNIGAGSRSLQDIASSQLLSQLTQEANPTSSFFTLEEPQQRLVLDQLFRDHNDASALRSKVAYHDRSWPSADRALCRVPEKVHERIFHGELEDYDEYITEDDNEYVPVDLREKEVDAHGLKDHFGGEWEFATSGPTEDNFGSFRSEASWSSLNLYRETEDSPLKTCGPYMPENKRCEPTCFQHYKQNVDFGDAISSQLLLYRILVVFGVPESLDYHLDTYKQCWGVRLLRKGDEKSGLELYDYKGGASLKFCGTDKTSGEALELVNFLVSPWVPHSYDGVIAGFSA